MTRSAMITTALLVAGALCAGAGLCQAQTHASGATERALAAHKDIAKTYLKGALLEGYNQALTQTSAAALAGADRIRADADAVAQCQAVLEKTVPHMQKWTVQLRREYRRLQGENQALHAEYARLQNLPKWTQRYQLEASYQRQLARHIVSYRVYLAQRQPRAPMLLGMMFCARITQKGDPQLGARWAGEISRLQAVR
jgi:hypothetical protein